MSGNRVSHASLRRHDMLADMAEQVAHRLIKHHKLDAAAAADVGNDLADFLRAHWRGQTIYVSGNKQHSLDQRDWEIYARFGRGNANDLAKEFGLSYVRVYQIYKRCRAMLMQQAQPSLWAGDDELSTDLSTR